ncbi:hypothetical protein MMC30_006230 [Trapelia coarctata]|nr:hypothetical protein [Trapelia coarctata]
MVPRAYKYASPPLSRSLSDYEKSGMMETKEATKKEAAKRSQDTRPTKPSRMWTVPAAIISQPVVIPTRSQSPRKQNRRSPARKVQKEEQRANTPHKPDVVSPPLSAAIKATPRPKAIAAFSDSVLAKQRRSTRSLNSAHAAESRQPLSSSSPRSWSILQSPPDESDPDSWSLGSDSTIAPLLSFRSLSTDSMPSLDIDLESPESASHPSTPGRSARRDRHLKSLSESLVEDCGLDHPLSPSNDELMRKEVDMSNICETETIKPEISLPVSPLRSSFKSNLTASIRVLRSAARSFSNMAIQRDEFLTRSILSISPQFTDERRPVLTDDVPDPALRRYLNPITTSPSELFYHDHSWSRAANDRCTASIQLQTYKRASTPSKNATVPPVFNPSAKDASKSESIIVAYSASRQREPRENSDFLRVIVLEMNMRKAGKLNDVAQGRARIWLPPRQLTKQQETEVNGVPRRWTGIVE